ncbi:MAG: site-specific integrase [Prevotellaceae bacterium]|jgi:site-specific recombinase XerD|nr:site-specific integrase [Prevotellaceae bacterium]
MKRSTFKVLFYLKRDKQKSNGLVPLFCRITVDGKESRFGMKCGINPKFWDVKLGKATGRTTEAANINSVIDGAKSAIFAIYRDLQERENYVTAERVKNVFLGIEVKQRTLLTLFDEHNKARKQSVETGKSSYSMYCLTRRYVYEFLMSEKKMSDIAMREVSTEIINDFKNYLLKKGLKEVSAINFLKHLRHIIKVAIKREWLGRNPFDGVSLTVPESNRGFLLQLELDALLNFHFEEKELETVRDVFVFCAFTGLAHSDVKKLLQSDIQPSFDGKLWIRGFRKKTGTAFDIPLLQIPEMILEKYKNQTNKFALPVCSLPLYNKRLKAIGALCGIAKRLTSHLARHTFATTVTLTNGVSLETVSKMLGHKSLKTTQIYAKIINEKISNDMEMLASKLQNYQIAS